MSKNWVADIAAMHKRFGVHDWIKTASPYNLRKFIDFRLDFIEEEFEETQNAHFAEDAEEVVDGLIDICVVALGTLDALGVDAELAWNKVYNANMSKSVGIKPERPNPLGLPDLIKPAGWKAPSHADNHGIIAHSFLPKEGLNADIWGKTDLEEAALDGIINYEDKNAKV